MNATPTRTPPQAQTGRVRWIQRPSGPTLYGRFAVTVETTRGVRTTEYDLAAVLDNDRVLGFGLAKDDDEIHHIDASQPWGWTCDCGDCQFRNRECKHIRAVRAALTAAGIALVKSGKVTAPVAKPGPAGEPEDEETVEITEEPPQPQRPLYCPHCGCLDREHISGFCPA